MQRMVAGSVRQVVLCATLLIALGGAGAGWAVQSDRAPPARQAKERPIFLACTGDQQSKWNLCVTERRAGCTLMVEERRRLACFESVNSSCSSALGVQC
ncbi:MAG: hypothetical protein K9G48_10940 [Reyranella sp.]|nr:hypothetical protein [Reyranella sp.]